MTGTALMVWGRRLLLIGAVTALSLVGALTLARFGFANDELVLLDADGAAAISQFDDPQDNPSFLPRECSVENWCVVRATECAFTQHTHPQGLWQAHAQYSILRRFSVLCSSGPYGGELQRRTILGPVEPVRFSSEILAREFGTREQAVGLCQVYRADWVAAAPACPAE